MSQGRARRTRRRVSADRGGVLQAGRRQRVRPPVITTPTPAAARGRLVLIAHAIPASPPDRPGGASTWGSSRRSATERSGRWAERLAHRVPAAQLAAAATTTIAHQLQPASVLTASGRHLARIHRRGSPMIIRRPGAAPGFQVSNMGVLGLPVCRLLRGSWNGWAGTLLVSRVRGGR